MQKLRIRMNRRGVSPIIATLLLVAIAVAAAVVTYTWTMSMAQNQSTQSQTSVKLDQVLFGQSLAVSTTLSGAEAVGQTVLEVASTTGFAVGDVIIVDNAEIKTITAIAAGVSITVDPAIVTARDASDPVARPAAEGFWMSIRNTGSIAATIEKLYIYEGDDLLTASTGITINNVVSSGQSEGTAVVDAGGASDTSYYTNLLSGGRKLPTADVSVAGNIGTFAVLDLNKPYTIRLVTNTGFIVEGTFYTPGSFT